MGVHFVLAICLFIRYENLVLACHPREYKINGICCPMCDKGSFVKTHCTSELSSSVCVICEDHTYTDHPNGLTECLRCTECDIEAGLRVKETCTSSSNTICECKTNHFCLNEDCDLCQEHAQCQPGQYVKTAGTRRTDTVCEKCPPGHFSNESNMVDCFPWRKCSELNLVLYKEGTSTNDSICKEKRGHGWIALAVLFPAIVLIPVLKQRYGSIKQEKNQTYVDPEYNKYPLSEEEKGTSELDSNNSP